MARRKINQSRREEMQRLRDAGVSDADIGRTFGITRERVAQILGRKGPGYPRKWGRATRPLFDGVGDFVSLQDALTRHPVRSAASGGRFQVYIECEPLAGNLRMGDSITEVPRRFEDRFLSVQTIEVER